MADLGTFFWPPICPNPLIPFGQKWATFNGFWPFSKKDFVTFGTVSDSSGHFCAELIGQISSKSGQKLGQKYAEKGCQKRTKKDKKKAKRSQKLQMPDVPKIPVTHSHSQSRSVTPSHETPPMRILKASHTQPCQVIAQCLVRVNPIGYKRTPPSFIICGPSIWKMRNHNKFRQKSTSAFLGAKWTIFLNCQIFITSKTEILKAKCSHLRIFCKSTFSLVVPLSECLSSFCLSLFGNSMRHPKETSGKQHQWRGTFCPKKETTFAVKTNAQPCHG